jgi:putative membrane protein insertion efficiency factor
LLSFVKKVFANILIAIVRFYQLAISPLYPATCRYAPTCSQYMIEAIRVHGVLRGTWMGLRRISKCHPWGGSGYDPVPPKKEENL